MPRTEIDRRQFLGGSLGLLGAASVPWPAGSKEVERLYAATRRSAAGDYSAAIFDVKGQDLNAVGLPARGHDVTVCPVTRRCVAFARRPGNFAVAFSADSSMVPVRFTSLPDRHFYGHGVFSPDGRLLFATENDFAAAKGRIGIYDALDGFTRKGEFSAYGTGPHDLTLLSDGVTLVIANGGIATHPDFGAGRLPLNLATMDPCLCYVDRMSGDLVEKHTLPGHLHKASLRHLDRGAKDRIVIGCQSKAAYGGEEPLILRHRLGDELSTVSLNAALNARMRGYVSSVAVDKSGKTAALTSSKGGVAVFLEVATGRVLGHRRLRDVSGVAAGPRTGEFLLTSGFGAIRDGASAEAISDGVVTDWHWDNHAVAL